MLLRDILINLLLCWRKLFHIWSFFKWAPSGFSHFCGWFRGFWLWRFLPYRGADWDVTEGSLVREFAEAVRALLAWVVDRSIQEAWRRFVKIWRLKSSSEWWNVEGCLLRLQVFEASGRSHWRFGSIIQDAFPILRLFTILLQETMLFLAKPIRCWAKFIWTVWLNSSLLRQLRLPKIKSPVSHILRLPRNPLGWWTILASTVQLLLKKLLLGRWRFWLVLNVLALWDVPVCGVLVELTQAVGALDQVVVLGGHLVGELTDLGLDGDVMLGVRVLFKLIYLFS